MPDVDPRVNQATTAIRTAAESVTSSYGQPTTLAALAAVLIETIEERAKGFSLGERTHIYETVITSLQQARDVI